jgi:tetratricopeptide (TPR) repeat protein
MDYQAKYFEAHPDSKYVMLADNVNRPFNEYLLLLSNYGVIGFVLFLAFAGFIGYSFYRNKNKTIWDRISVWCLLAIAVFSLFSYPLIYPFVWIMGIISIISIVYQANYSVRIYLHKRIVRLLEALMVAVIFACGSAIHYRMTSERLWCSIAHKSLAGQTEQMLPVYEHLHKQPCMTNKLLHYAKSLENNELFLYNYAAELNVVKQYDKSLEIAHECERLWADYDLQMLMADNYRQIQQYQEAEQHYIKASNMCPVKFMPLHQLVEVYDETGHREEALSLARKIIDKEVKIPSSTVSVIKQKMQQLIEKSEAEKVIETKNVPASEIRTRNQRQTTEPGPGGFSDAPYATRPP